MNCITAKHTAKPVNIVVAVPDDSPWTTVEDLPQGVKVSTEYPQLTKSYFATKGIEASIHLSYGATEAKAPK